MRSVQEAVCNYLDQHFDVVYDEKSIYKLHWFKTYEQKSKKVELSMSAVYFNIIDNVLEDCEYDATINFEIITLDWAEQKLGCIPDHLFKLREIYEDTKRKAGMDVGPVINLVKI
jgi:hypothetical protein